MQTILCHHLVLLPWYRHQIFLHAWIRSLPSRHSSDCCTELKHSPNHHLTIHWNMTHWMTFLEGMNHPCTMFLDFSRISWMAPCYWHDTCTIHRWKRSAAEQTRHSHYLAHRDETCHQNRHLDCRSKCSGHTPFLHTDHRSPSTRVSTQWCWFVHLVLYCFIRQYIESSTVHTCRWKWTDWCAFHHCRGIFIIGIAFNGLARLWRTVAKTPLNDTIHLGSNAGEFCRWEDRFKGVRIAFSQRTQVAHKRTDAQTNKLLEQDQSQQCVNMDPSRKNRRSLVSVRDCVNEHMSRDLKESTWWSKGSSHTMLWAAVFAEEFSVVCDWEKWFFWLFPNCVALSRFKECCDNGEICSMILCRHHHYRYHHPSSMVMVA